MILDVLAFRNKVMGCYTNPIFTQEKLENQEANMFRSLVYGGDSAIAKYKNLALYHLGKFDDEKGKFELCEPELLFDCDDLIARVPKE